MLFINLLDAVLAAFLLAGAMVLLEMTNLGILATVVIFGGAFFIYRTFAPFILSGVIDFFNRETDVA